MASLGRGVQNNHSRGGQKSTKEAKKPRQAKEQTSDRLSQLKADYPELYEASKTLANRVGVSSSEMDSYLITFMENVIETRRLEEKEAEVLARLKRGWEEKAAQSQ